MIETCEKKNKFYPEIEEGFDAIIRISDNNYKKIDYSIFEF